MGCSSGDNSPMSVSMTIASPAIYIYSYIYIYIFAYMYLFTPLFDLQGDNGMLFWRQLSDVPFNDDSVAVYIACIYMCVCVCVCLFSPLPQSQGDNGMLFWRQLSDVRFNDDSVASKRASSRGSGRGGPPERAASSGSSGWKRSASAALRTPLERFASAGSQVG